MRDRLMRWFGRLGGGGLPPRPKESGRLPGLLAAYPQYRAPHPGPPKAVTRKQCDANLAYLLEQRPARLAALGELVGRFGIDLAGGLAAADPRPLLDALHAWSRAEWPAIVIEGLTGYGDGYPRWLGSDKGGQHIALSMLMDVAIVLGETVVARRPDYAWRLDLERGNRQMLSYRRPVVMSHARPEHGWPATVLDFEAIVIDLADGIGRGLAYDGRSLGYAALAAIEGGYDPPEPADAAVDLSRLRPIYDKAKHHAETVEEFRLPHERAGMLPAYFFGWLIERGLLSPECRAQLERPIAAYLRRDMTALAVFYEVDGVLTETMLSEEANAFALAYYGPGSSGPYVEDFMEVVAPGLASQFHATYDWNSQALLNARIDSRRADWQKTRED
ncbi:hypothetical protein BN1110_04305 [bacterium YEK0313]|nr:hypothetical protein BN1110_04305 [bacterium YEK0313]